MRSPGRRKSKGETDCDALIPLQPPPATARESKSRADKATRLGYIPSRIAQRDKHSKPHSVSEIPARRRSMDMIFRGSIGKCDPRTEKPGKNLALPGAKGASGGSFLCRPFLVEFGVSPVDQARSFSGPVLSPIRSTGAPIRSIMER